VDGEILEHFDSLGRVQHAGAVVAHRGNPPIREPERASPPRGHIVHLLRTGVSGGGEDRGVAARAHQEQRNRGEYAVAGLGLSVRPEAAGEAHHRRVPRVRVGVAEGARLAVRGAQAVQQVEALQEQDARASGRRRVCRAATHDAGAQDYQVEVETAGSGGGHGRCGIVHDSQILARKRRPEAAAAAAATALTWGRRRACSRSATVASTLRRISNDCAFAGLRAAQVGPTAWRLETQLLTTLPT